MKKAGGSADEKLFYITKLGGDVGLTQICSYTDEQKVVQVPAEVVISNWGLHKGDCPVKMAKNQCRNAFQFELDAMKASLYTALMAADSKAMLKDSAAVVIFYRRPDVVYSSKNISKGALTLIPMAPLKTSAQLSLPLQSA